MKTPISPLRATWVPPHSSRVSATSTTRTTSPYFSPNSAMAPAAMASSYDIWRMTVAVLLRISALTMASTAWISSGVIGLLWLKSKRV